MAIAREVYKNELIFYMANQLLQQLINEVIQKIQRSLPCLLMKQWTGVESGKQLSIGWVDDDYKVHESN